MQIPINKRNELVYNTDMIKGNKAQAKQNHPEPKGAKKMTVDIFKIRWTKVTSHRFDSTSFKKAMPELYGQFTKQTESRRFSIA